MTDIPTTAPAAAPSSEPAQASNPAPKDRIKVDGVEEEWSPEDLKKYAQIGRAKEKRFEESAKAKKEAESIKERYKSAPWEVMKELGLNPRELSEKFLLQELEEEQLSPAQKEERALKKRLKDYEDKELTAKEARQAEAHAQEVQKHAVQLDQEISAALQSSAIPKSPAAIRRVAKVMFDALEAGEDISTAEAISMVEDEYESDIKELFAMIGDPSKFLPPDLAKKLMGQHLDKVKGAPQSKPQGSPAAKQEKAPKTISTRDFNKKLFGN